MDSEDLEILKGVKNGEEPAVDALIKKYQKKVYNMVYGLCFNYDTAWDVTQEAFVKIIRSMGKFRGESSLWTYIYRIARNSFYDFKRKEKVRSKVGNFSDMKNDEEKREFEVRDLVNIEEDYEKKAAGEKIRGAMERLTDIQKEVFILKHNGGYKIREISLILKISQGTVKSHLNRSMEKLKTLMGGDEL